jgi:hypothetical protein
VRYDLRELVDALEWTPRAGGAARSWNDGYEHALATRFHDAVEGRARFEAVAQGYELLDASERRRFLMSPRVAAELLAGDREQVSVGVVSAALSTMLATSAQEPTSTALAPLDVGSSLPAIDADGDFPPRAGDSGPLAPLTREQVCRADERLRQAATTIAAVSGEAAAFVASFTHLVVLRADPVDEAGFRSGSLAGYPGLTILVNPHADRCSVEVMVDALVHEAIHGAIYTFEEIVAPLLSTRASDEIRLTSPWTGASLTIDSYVQACFVWYGLYRFWDRAILARAAAEPLAEPLRARARRGFLAQPVTTGLGPSHETYLSERVMDALLRVEGALGRPRSPG